MHTRPQPFAQFPMNVTQTRFGARDATSDLRRHSGRVLGGGRFDKNDPSHLNYREKLLAAGIETFFFGGLWPSPDVTPESLGRKGWDGNIAIEWLPSTCLRKDRRQSLEASRQ
jgi:hypothetical protein